jgi:hypothetical protein
LLLWQGYFFQVDKIVAFYFDLIIQIFLSLCILATSNETETGTAGEQPVRDKFD